MSVPGSVLVPLAIWVVGVSVALLSAWLDHRRGVRQGDLSVGSPDGSDACLDARELFRPATADDEEAVRRLELIRRTDCVYDRPTYPFGEVPVRLHDLGI